MIRGLVAALVLVLAAPVGAQPALEPATPLPAERERHAAAIVARHLYVIGGGETKQWVPTAGVLAAPIREDGSLGAWTPQRALPRPTVEAIAATHANRLYVVGGLERHHAMKAPDQPTRVIDTALVATVAADGTLGEWRESPPWPGGHGRACATAANDRALYVSGGASANDTRSDQVLIGRLDTDGVPTEWTSTTPLPQPLFGHAMHLRGETLFVLGGRSTAKPEGLNAAIHRSRLQADGTPGPWIRLDDPHPLPTFQGGHAATRAFLFCVGGKDRNWRVVDSISYATLSAEGVAGWQVAPVPGGPLERVGLAASGELGLLYLTGGRASNDNESMRAEVNWMRVKTDAEVLGTLPADAACLVPYEEALGRVRVAGGRLLVVTLSPAMERSVAYARELCTRPVDDHADLVPAVVNLRTEAALARRLGMLQPGAVAIVDANENVLVRSPEAFPVQLPRVP